MWLQKFDPDNVLIILFDVVIILPKVTESSSRAHRFKLPAAIKHQKSSSPS
jgi:hypothetical protein